MAIKITGLLNEDERPSQLNEMATVCDKNDGYGMIIEVYSKDHGVIGNKANPAHAHLKTSDKEYLGKFAITDQPPRNGLYVIDCDKKKSIPSDWKGKIVNWANRKDSITGAKNWKMLIAFWKRLHPQG